MIFFKKLLVSQLHNEKTFYKEFIRDLKQCKSEVIIESPYITTYRMEKLYPLFEELLTKGIKIHIITRDPIDHDENIRHQATNEILYSMGLGINIILLRGYHHRKLAVIDRSVLWEGSLNILSYSSSLEVMRRIEGNKFASEMIHFLKLSNLA